MGSTVLSANTKITFKVSNIINPISLRTELFGIKTLTNDNFIID